MTRIIIRPNPLNHSEDVVYNDIAVGDFLYGYFKRWPATAKLYQDKVCSGNEIQIKNKSDVSGLNSLTGTVYCVIYPAGMAAIGIGLIAGTAALSHSSKSKKSAGNAASGINDQASETETEKTLSKRTNSPRAGGRIPDIYGTMRVTPDLIAAPYEFYKENVKYEHSLMCVGRGNYDVDDIREGDTPLSEIKSESVEFYAPYTSPNNGLPFYSKGTIDEPFVQATKVESIKDQVVIAPNEPGYVDKFVDLRIHGPGIVGTTDPTYDLTEHFSVSDTIDLSDNPLKVYTVDSVSAHNGWWQPATVSFVTSFSLAGTYTISAVTSSSLTLQNYATVNTNWNTYQSYYDLRWIATQIHEPINTGYAFNNAVIDTRNIAKSKNVGPFIVEDADDLLFNFVFPAGLYVSSDSGDDEITTGLTIELEITYQQVDASDVPFGSVHTETVEIEGLSKTFFAYTHKSTMPFSGRVQVEVERITDGDTGVIQNNTGSRSEVKVESVYSFKDITLDHFGDVTIVRTLAYAVENGPEERRFNLRASRLIPVRLLEEVFSEPQATSLASDIIVAIATDPKIGNRQLSELDLDQIYDTIDSVGTYFGTDLAKEFNHAFVNESISFEETLAAVAEAVFCIAYRQSEKLKLFFERTNDNSTLLFNHRNKLPETETRTIMFGTFEDKDGVEIEYIDDNDGKKEIFFLPADESYVDADKIKQIGVVHKLIAYFHAHRVFNRMLYQNIAVEFDATQEASLLIPTERILIADNTRTKTYDGEVIAQSGTTLTLSQDFVFETGKSYTVFLQNIDGSVQSIAISPGPNENQIVLASGTTLPLSVGSNNYARATYEIVENDSVRKQAFLIAEKEPQDNFVIRLTAINYDERYYSNDSDYINNIVDIDGNLI